MLDLFGHPVALFFLSFSIDVLVVAFTSPSSIIRPACLPILCFNVWLMLHSGKTVDYTHPMYANLLGGSVFTLALQYFNLVILRKSSYEAGGPTTTPEGEPLRFSSKETANWKGQGVQDGQGSTFRKLRRRIIWGVSHFLDNRLSGTPWEVKNVPLFSKEDRNYVPPRKTFLGVNMLVCIASVVLLDLARPSADTDKNAILFDDSKVPFFSRLRSVTAEDIAMRLVTTFTSTIITYLLFQAMYTSMAVVAVGLNISQPKRWRPLFGSLSDGWSLRRAWGMFWHQGMTSCLTGPAKYITFGLLRLPKDSLLARYLFTAIVFVLSGAMHVCGEVTAGIPLSESGVIHFFATQALGLLIEDAVVGIWRRIASKESRVRWWQKALGFSWVVLWLAWSMPVWTYPASKRSQGEGILPFSIIDRFKGS